MVNHTLTLCSLLAYCVGGARFFGLATPLARPLLYLAVGYSLLQILVNWAVGPVARYVLLAGTCAAWFVSMVAVLLSRQMSWASMYHYFGFMLSSVLLGCAFLSLAVMLSVFASDRTRASGLAIAMWFFFVLIFDLLVLGVLVVTAGQWGGEALPYALLFNPADVFRILNIFSMDDVRTLYGLSTVFPPALAQPWLLGLVMAAWIVGPLAIAAWRFRR